MKMRGREEARRERGMLGRGMGEHDLPLPSPTPRGVRASLAPSGPPTRAHSPGAGGAHGAGVRGVLDRGGGGGNRKPGLCPHPSRCPQVEGEALPPPGCVLGDGGRGGGGGISAALPGGRPRCAGAGRAGENGDGRELEWWRGGGLVRS